jgi:4-hydroxy-L-threonine phosphate dehydrogenase PdxA
MKPLAITLGDPAGIGAEIVAKALREMNVPVWVFGSRAFAAEMPAVERFVDVGGTGSVQYGVIDAAYGRIALDSIDAAIDAINAGHCSALVTAPIHKQAITLAGSVHPGHTELLAARAGLARYGYVSLREAIDAIDASTIAALALLMDREYRRLYGQQPRIAVAGVNPHAGEGGKFGAEETIIAAGVDEARSQGLSVSGPHPPDTVFLAATEGRYDVVMAMYHDQGLIPVKTLAFKESVNVTIGLPYLRVSVDHGTAFDIAGKGIADAAPMKYAIEWAARFAR